MNLDERFQKDLSPDIYCLVHNKIVNLEQQYKKKKEVISQQNEKSKNSTRKVITTTNSKGLWVFTKQD